MKYVWIQAGVVAIQKGLSDWTIYIINYKYYLSLNNVESVNEIFEIGKQTLLEYADAVYTYNKEKNYSLFIRDICQYIKKSLPNSLTIAEIAKAHNFSESYLAHCFKKETGISIGKYIRNEKIKQAMDMISKGISFLEITYSLDFSSQSHFSRQFKKVTNMTPNEYRNLIRESNI